MRFKKGMVVRSKAGHDKGSFFVVLCVEDGIALIADGVSRTINKPKRKNLIHLSATATVLDERSMEADIEIRKILVGFNDRVRSS